MSDETDYYRFCLLTLPSEWSPGFCMGVQHSYPNLFLITQLSCSHAAFSWQWLNFDRCFREHKRYSYCCCCCDKFCCNNVTGGFDSCSVNVHFKEETHFKAAWIHQPGWVSLQLNPCLLIFVRKPCMYIHLQAAIRSDLICSATTERSTCTTKPRTSGWVSLGYFSV